MSSRAARRRKKHRITALSDDVKAAQTEAMKWQRAHFHAETAKNVVTRERKDLALANEFMYEVLKEVAGTDLESAEAVAEPRKVLEQVVGQVRTRFEALEVRDNPQGAAAVLDRAKEHEPAPAAEPSDAEQMPEEPGSDAEQTPEQPESDDGPIGPPEPGERSDLAAGLTGPTGPGPDVEDAPA